MAIYLELLDAGDLEAAGNEVGTQTGAPKDWTSLPSHMRTCSWDDFIDCIAHIANGLSDERARGPYSLDSVRPRRRWLQFIRPAFDEEHVTFGIDEEGSPQPVVDAAFSELVDATLDGLNDPRFENAKSDVLAALKHMKKADTLDEAIDSTFKSAENIFKMSSGASRLTESAEKYYRENWADELDLPERNAAGRMIVSLCQWVNAAHNYRHADNQQKPTPPSRETAVWIISTGLAHIRWMAHVYRELDKAKSAG